MHLPGYRGPHRAPFICLLFMLCVCMISTAGFASAAYGKTGVVDVPIHTEPGTRAPIIAYIEAFATPLALEQTLEANGDTWYRVTYQDDSGYVLGKLVDPIDQFEYAERLAAFTPPTSSLPPQASSDSSRYIGNTKSKKFHKPTCKTLPDPQNQTAFTTRDAAVMAGFTPCGNCKP